MPHVRHWRAEAAAEHAIFIDDAEKHEAINAVTDNPYNLSRETSSTPPPDIRRPNRLSWRGPEADFGCRLTFPPPYRPYSRAVPRIMTAAARQRRYRDRRRRGAPLVEFEPEPEWIDLLVDARVMSRDDTRDKVARGNAFKEAFLRLLVGRLPEA
jgi:hypothetical protein